MASEDSPDCCTATAFENVIGSFVESIESAGGTHFFELVAKRALVRWEGDIWFARLYLDPKLRGELMKIYDSMRSYVECLGYQPMIATDHDRNFEILCMKHIQQQLEQGRAQPERMRKWFGDTMLAEMKNISVTSEFID